VFISVRKHYTQHRKYC